MIDDTTYTFRLPQGRGRQARKPHRRHEFTISRDHHVRAGRSDGPVIGRVEQRNKRWFPFDKEDTALSGRRGYRRAGDAAAEIYRKYLKAGGMPHQQLSLFEQAKVIKVEDLSARSAEFQARKRIKLCAEWYQHEEGKSRKQAYAMCHRMEEQGQLRDDGSYIAVKKGQSARGRKAEFAVTLETPPSREEREHLQAVLGSIAPHLEVQVVGSEVRVSGADPEEAEIMSSVLTQMLGSSTGRRAKDASTGRVLVHKDSGKLVKVGDEVTTFRGEPCVVTHIQAPHKPGSTGRVYVKVEGAEYESGFFPSVIGAEWRKFEALLGGQKNFRRGKGRRTGRRAETRSPATRGYKYIGAMPIAHGAQELYYWHPKTGEVLQTHYSPQTHRETAWESIGEADSIQRAQDIAGLAKGQRAAFDSKEAALGMLKRYSTPEKARGMAFDHAMDQPRGSDNRAYWMSVVREIEDRADLRPYLSEGSAGLKKGVRNRRGRRASVGQHNLAKFKKAYNKAKKAGDESFMFEGQEVLVAYAKYLIEYLEGLNPSGRRSLIRRVGGRAACRRAPRGVPQKVWDDAVSTMRDWILAGKPDDFFQDVDRAVAAVTARMVARGSFMGTWAAIERAAEAGFPSDQD